MPRTFSEAVLYVWIGFVVVMTLWHIFAVNV